MDIPAEAVEAVARAIGCYDTAPGDNRREHREAAREALEVAAPFIAAQAWDEGYMRGQYPFTVEGQEDPIPPARFPPSWGGNANPYRDPQ